MIRRPPRSTRTDTLFPYTTLFRSTLDSLKNHQMLAYGDDILSPYGHLSSILELGTTTPLIERPYLKINSLEGLVNAVKEGLGIAQISGELPSIRNSDQIGRAHV